MEVKFFKYDTSKINNKKISSAFSDTQTYFMTDNIGVLAIHCDIDKNKRMHMMEIANEVGLKPISMTRIKFLKLLEKLISNQNKVVNIDFTGKIGEEDNDRLNNLMISKSSDIYEFTKEILRKYEIFIKRISWFEKDQLPVKISLYDNGVFFANGDTNVIGKSYLNEVIKI